MLVAEMGCRMEVALHDRHRLEDALKATRAALNAIKVEVETTHLAADGAEARRIGMYLGRFMIPRLPSGGVGFP
jgi:hypothetical protein